MRILALLVLLAALFGLAWFWQTGTLARMRAERAATLGVERGGRRDPAFEALPDGWGVVVIGAPSGAEPVFLERSGRAPSPPSAELEARPEDLAAGASWTELEQRALGDYRIEILAGQTLSSIADAYYGERTRELVESLARYNGLSSADALPVGETLLLPPRERLIGE